MTSKSRFTQADIIRAIKGVQGAGLEVGAVHVSSEGVVTIIVKGYEESARAAASEANWFDGSPLFSKADSLDPTIRG